MDNNFIDVEKDYQKIVKQLREQVVKEGLWHLGKFLYLIRRGIIQDCLKKFNGNRSQVARHLGVDSTTISKMCSKGEPTLMLNLWKHRKRKID